MLNQEIDSSINNKLYQRVASIIELGRVEATQAIYNVMTKSYYSVGKEIVEEEQKGLGRAEYGKELLKNLSQRLTQKYGRGFSVSNLKEMREFYVIYSKGQTVSVQFKLSFSHYVLLTTLHESERYFYEQLAIKEKLSVRKLKEAVSRNEYDRSLKNGRYDISKEDKNEVLHTTNPIVKDPLILDFLGLEKGTEYLESDLEKRIINNLERFLLEIGKGFAFIGRQYPIYLSGKYYHVDLVFYHVVLKCYVLIDLKRGNIEHGDLGQMMMYVNYFDKDIKQNDDVLTVGVVLGANKDDAVVEYTLGDNKQVFATRYMTYLPSKEELVGILNQSKEQDSD
ncbi:MAG: PDDEXK nuclease domain-containing protein [Patescibacteria group bacterium]